MEEITVHKTDKTGMSGFITEGLYRLPWTSADNAMSWLEPTRSCNLKCDACFHFPDPKSHKSLEQIENELKLLQRLRKCDALLIGGGEPLTHPDIIEIVRMVKMCRVKPVLMTNGIGLDRQMTTELKKAGLRGITFHIDAHQKRPGWENCSENELNELRTRYAWMLKEVKGLTCAYNTTIFPDTLEDVPSIVEWALKNADKVHILSLIAVRMIHESLPYDFCIGNKKISIEETPYQTPANYRNISSEEILEQLRKIIPGYSFNSYLGGTALPWSPKWMLSTHAAIPGESFGNLGPYTMELMQSLHHNICGTYLGFNKSYMNKSGKGLFIFSIFDRQVRRLLSNYLKYLVYHPAMLFRPLFLQCITIVQPADILENGETDNCDGCPNKTLWNNRLISACRLEEYLRYGAPIHTVPKESEAVIKSTTDHSKYD